MDVPQGGFYLHTDSISKAGLVSENVVLERSRIPNSPVWPRFRMTYVACLAAALVLSIALIIIKYKEPIKQYKEKLERIGK